MAWIEGTNSPLEITDWNSKYLETLHGELEEEQARETLGQFMRHNIGLTVWNLTGFILESYQRIIIKGWLQKNFTLCVAGRSFSKCIDENSLVLTELCGIRAMKDVTVGERIWADKGFQTIEGRTDNPIESGLRVDTKFGYSCTGKMGHKMLVLNQDTLDLDWKVIEDVKDTDVVPIRYGMNSFGNVNPVAAFQDSYVKKHSFEKDLALVHEPDLYYFLGVILGDGCLRTQGSSTLVTNEDQEVIDHVTKSISRYLPHSKMTVQSNGSNAYTYRFYGMGFKRFLYSVGFDEEKAHNKHFPRTLLGLNRDALAAFIRGLYDTDGYSKFTYNAKQCVCFVGLTSASHDILKVTQTVLANLGIISSIVSTHKAGLEVFSNGKTYETHAAWTLFINNRDSVARFSKAIGFGIVRKQKNIDDYLAASVDSNPYHFNLVPVGAYFEAKYGLRAFRQRGIRLHVNLSVARLHEFLDFDFIDETDKTKIRTIVDGGYFFNPVKTIIPIQTKTIDIQVANECCYWSDGFVNHNSFLAAHFCYLYALFHREHHILMVSATFRSSRRVLENVETWANRKARDGNPGGVLLDETIDKVSKKPDQYVIRFKNGSTITAVPLGDPDNLRGFRCNVLIIDEGLLIPQSTIDLVLKPFLAGGSDITKKQKIRKRESQRIAAGKMKEEERQVFKSTSKMIILSSASYRWEELYQTYQKYLKIIDPDPNAPDAPAREQMEGGSVSSYLVQQLSYKVAREELMDPAIVKEIKEKLIPEPVIKREYEAQFIDESGGYFSAKEMMQCTIPPGQRPCIEIVGDKDAQYILGIDPNVAASDSADHFAMCVLKVIKRESDGRKIGLVVHQYGCCGVELKHHISYLYYLLTKFKPVYVICDTTQGDAGDFLSICNESEHFKSRALELNPIQAEFTNESFDEIVKQVKRSYNPDSSVRRIVQKQPLTSPIIRSGNEHLRACFDQKLLLFASHAQSIPNMVPSMCEQDVMSIHRSHPEYTDHATEGMGNMYEFVTYQDNMIEVVKKECALIEMVASPTGNVTFDLPHSMTRNRKNRNRQRRDSYAALWMATWALKIFLAMEQMPIVEEDDMPAPRWI